MAGPLHGFDAPQAIPPQNPWHWDPQTTISTGLHISEQWNQHPHNHPPLLEHDSASGRVPAWLEYEIIELIKSSPSCNEALLDRVLSALGEQDLQGLEQRGCSCGGQHSMPPQSPSGSCLWCRAKSRLGNVKQVGNVIKRALSNAGRHLRHRKSSESISDNLSSLVNNTPASVSPTISPLPGPKSHRPPVPQASIAHPNFMAELPADLTYEPQHNAIPTVSYPGWGQATEPSELETGASFEQTPMSSDGSKTEMTREWNPFNTGAADDVATERSTTFLSTLSDSSVSTRGRPSLVSKSSRSTASTELTRISTNHPTVFGKGVYESPTTIEEARKIAPRATDEGSTRQESSTSLTSTHVAHLSVFSGNNWDRMPWINPSEALAQISASSPDPFAAALDAYQDSPCPQELPPPYTVLNERPTWDSNAQQPPVYSAPSSPQPGNAAAGDWERIYLRPNLLEPQLSSMFDHPVSHSQVSNLSGVNHHHIPELYSLLHTPDTTNQYISPAAFHNTGFPGMRPPAYRHAAAAASPDTNVTHIGAEAGQMVVTPASAVDTLPSARKSWQSRKTTGLKRDYRRSSNSYFCCGKEFKMPGIRKKLRRHRNTDEHRRRTQQEVVERLVCECLDEDGSVCRRKYGREDNLQQHRRKKHPDVSLPLQSNGPARR